jgi:hypothetical protein
MHLAADYIDYIHPTPRDGRCRIRIYLPKDEQDTPVVTCSELPNNEGSSVTYSANQIAAEVIRYQKLSAPVWIEHYPKGATDGHSETFELVVFSSYEVKERAPYLGETRLTVGEPAWKKLDRKSVEALVEEELYSRFLATQLLKRPEPLHRERV